MGQEGSDALLSGSLSEPPLSPPPSPDCPEVGRGLQVWVPRLLSILFLPPDRLLCSGHDVSDGGLITCLLEMAFAGNCGIEVAVPASGVNGEEPEV